MIKDWTNIIENAVKDLQEIYSKDENSIINEDDLKYKVRQEIEKKATAESDMLLKPEVPWYDKDAPGYRPKFYFDLTIFKKSIFELRMRDQAMRRKGYYYNDNSIAVMLKFVKPDFRFSEIKDDIDKLVVFSTETKEEADNHKPLLIVAATDNRLFEQVENSIVNAVASIDQNEINRITILYFNRNKFKKYDLIE